MAGQKEAIAQILANIRGEDTDALREASIGALTADVDTTPSLSATIGQALGAALPLLFVDGQARGLAAGTSAKAFESAQKQSRQSLESQRKKLEKIAGLGLEVAGKRDDATAKRAEKLDERQFQLLRDSKRADRRDDQIKAQAAMRKQFVRTLGRSNAPATGEKAAYFENLLAKAAPEEYANREPGWFERTGLTPSDAWKSVSYALRKQREEGVDERSGIAEARRKNQLELSIDKENVRRREARLRLIQDEKKSVIPSFDKMKGVKQTPEGTKAVQSMYVMALNLADLRADAEDIILGKKGRDGKRRGGAGTVEWAFFEDQAKVQSRLGEIKSTFNRLQTAAAGGLAKITEKELELIDGTIIELNTLAQATEWSEKQVEKIRAVERRLVQQLSNVAEGNGYVFRGRLPSRAERLAREAREPDAILRETEFLAPFAPSGSEAEQILLMTLSDEFEPEEPE